MLAGVDFSQERYITINKILPEIKRIMDQDGRTLVQGLLGYLMATSETTIPIPGAKTIKQIEKNAKTLEFGPLSQGMVKQIDNLLLDQF